MVHTDKHVDDASTSGQQRDRRMPDDTATNLYVGGLHDSVGDAELLHRFKPFGNIVSAKVMLHIHTGQSRGLGFVKFETHSSAVAAIQAMHRTMFHGQRMMVRFADTRADFNPGAKTSKVFVRNLPFDVTPAMLREHMGQFGRVVECSMHLDTAGFKAGGCGARTRMAYVTFELLEDAQHAAETVHGTRPFPSCDRPVMAKIAESDEKRQQRRAQHRSPSPPSRVVKCDPVTRSARGISLDSSSDPGYAAGISPTEGSATDRPLAPQHPRRHSRRGIATSTPLSIAERSTAGSSSDAPASAKLPGWSSSDDSHAPDASPVRDANANRAETSFPPQPPHARLPRAPLVAPIKIPLPTATHAPTLQTTADAVNTAPFATTSTAQPIPAAQPLQPTLVYPALSYPTYPTYAAGLQYSAGLPTAYPWCTAPPQPFGVPNPYAAVFPHPPGIPYTLPQFYAPR